MSKKIIVFVIIILVVLILGSGYWFLIKKSVYNQGTPDEYFTVTEFGCKMRGGHIIESPATCKNNESNVGFIQGVKCPCFCCVPIK